MSNKYAKLFDPIRIKDTVIPNRFFMAPMGIVGMSDSNGAFTQRAIDYYVERAKGGTGLIITGVTKVDMEVEAFGAPSISIIPLNMAAFLQSAKVLTERVQAYNSKIFLQLGVGFGRSMVPAAIAMGAGQVAPSEVENRWNPNVIHRELTTEEVETIVKKTVEGAFIAKQAGFDGVEIHAIHEGYLLDQFTMELFNKRTDKYGGSFENRYRMAVEIVQGIKQVCGEDFPVTVRYSVKGFIKDIRQGGLPGEDFKELGRDTEEGIKAAKFLADAGYDGLNIDAGTYDSWYWNHPPMYFEDGMYLPFGKVVKEVVDIPVMVAGRMENPDLAVHALDNNLADMIGLGRPLLADSFIPEKIRKNQVEKIRPCLSCHDGCLGRLKQALPISCAVNPACGNEKEYEITKSHDLKNIMVIGGGPAGMEMARVATLRGHKVTLFEKSGRLGGNLIPGGIPDFKRYDHMLVKWYEQELGSLGVTIKYNTEISKEMINKSNFDTVVVCTGSKAKELNLENAHENNIYSACEVLMDEDKAGANVVIVGAGLVGGELALWLVQKGKKVTLVELSNEILGGEEALCFANYDMLKDLLNFHEVEILMETSAKEISKNGIVVERKDGSTKELKADTIVNAIGYNSDNTLYDELKFIDKDIVLLGDAKKVNNIMYAIWDAFEVARHI